MNQPVFDKVPKEFVYDHDFDRNGAIYYLGCLGYQTGWKNPDIDRKQVRAFASSMSSGRPSDILGRQTVNCYTQNQAFSFFGLQLGLGRKILPTCYSIKNRTSPHFVMLSWRFEASNDLINWHLLDTRVHNLNSGSDSMARKLIPSGATTTWGIDQSVFEQIGFEGFSAFRIV